jgi:peptidase E
MKGTYLGSPAPSDRRRILTLGGHDFTSRSSDQAICDLILELPQRPYPRICLLPTASGDPAEQTAAFYNAFADRDCEPSDLSLFRLGRKPVAVRDHLLDQDVIYVGGGSMANLLAIWEVHDVAAMLALAWRRGIALAGQSAGAMCWFAAGITRSSGESQSAAGLGLLPGSLCVHYRNEPDRRDAYLAKIGAAEMPPGYALDDHSGLIWHGATVAEAVTSAPGAEAFRVERSGGRGVEHRLDARRLAPKQVERVPADIAEFRREVRERRGVRLGQL